MKSGPNRLMVDGLRRQIAQERVRGLRPVWMRARRLEEGVDFSHLTVATSESLVNEAGIPFFIIGHSDVGGGDLVGA